MRNSSILFKTFFKFSTSSLYNKVPKTVQVQSESGFLAKLFSNTKNSPSYLLLKQLFQFLHTTDILQREFPFIKSDARFQENWMLIHAVILKKRLMIEKQFYKTISQAQIQKFDYNIQTYFFSKYGEYINPHIPVRNFAQHFTEVYMKKLDLFYQMNEQNQRQFRQSSQRSQNVPLSHYGQYIKRVVYEQRVKLSDLELAKLCKYYAAHTRYLESLEWQDLLEYKVKWGFEGDIQLIQNF